LQQIKFIRKTQEFSLADNELKTGQKFAQIRNDYVSGAILRCVNPNLISEYHNRTLNPFHILAGTIFNRFTI